MTTATLPAGYRVVAEDDALIRQLEGSIASGAAYETYHVWGDDEHCSVRWHTNDDRDHGTPTEYAEDAYELSAAADGSTVNGGPGAIGRALHFSGGGCRQGVGHAVIVRVNDDYVVKDPA